MLIGCIGAGVKATCEAIGEEGERQGVTHLISPLFVWGRSKWRSLPTHGVQSDRQDDGSEDG